MPKSPSAQKAARSSGRKRMRNRSIKSAIKTRTTKSEKLIESNELDSAQAAVLQTISALDKAAKKKIYHPNTAGRRKSRLMKKLNKAKVAAGAKPEIAKTETKKKKVKTKSKSA